MILAASNQMPENEVLIATRLIIEGFNDLAKDAGTKVTGGQTVVNPWPIIGGTATSVCRMSEFIMPVSAVAGDVIVLTKPIGTQVAVNAHQWMYNETRWNTVSHLISKEQAIEAYEKSIDSMSRLNRIGAILMHKYGAHACTDVTGFGLLGHAQNLVSNQKAPVDFEIHTLPILKNMKEVAHAAPYFKLLAGYSAETSGGLFVCLSANAAKDFCKEIELIDHYPAWIIGNVITKKDINSPNKAYISLTPSIIEV